MSNEPKKPSELILEKLTAMEKELQKLKKTTLTPEPEHVAMPESAKGHKTIEEVADCPTCKAKLIEKFRPEILKEVKEKLKSKELVVCTDCGEIVEKTERECPTCHGTHAH